MKRVVGREGTTHHGICLPPTMVYMPPYHTLVGVHGVYHGCTTGVRGCARVLTGCGDDSYSREVEEGRHNEAGILPFSLRINLFSPGKPAQKGIETRHRESLRTRDPGIPQPFRK